VDGFAYHRQSSDHTCGPASLRMLLRFHGIARTENTLAAALRTNEARGTNRADMVRIARAEGLRVRAGGMTLEELRRETAAAGPVIVNYVEPHENVGHFAVALSVSEAAVMLADPWHGEEFALSVDDFSARWLGYKTRDPRRGWGMIAGAKAFPRA